MLLPKANNQFYKFIVLTVSNPCNSQYRNIQRKYRNIYSNYILFIYIISYSEYDDMIYYEHKLYGDILFLNIKNHYFNITNIFLESISWINLKYKYDFIIKWDDDIVVNIPLLLLFSNLLKQMLHYCGYLYNKTQICRDKKRICFIPSIVYKYSFLPSFAASGLLILSRNTSFQLDYYHRIYKSYMIRDDQYIGVICKKLFIKPLPINRYYIRNNKNNMKINMKYIISYHVNSKYDLMYLSNVI